MFASFSTRCQPVDRLSKRSRALLAALFVFPLGWTADVPSSYAQEAAKPQFDEYKLDDTMRASFREKQKAVEEMLKGTAPYNKQEIAKFYTGILLPLLTSVQSPEKANDARKLIFDDIDRAEKSSESILNEFNAMLLEEMKKIAEGNYQPSSAIDATLILGSLNKKRERNVAPEPLMQATPILLALSTSGKNDGIRAAAMAKLDRHLDVFANTWPDNTRQVIADRLLKALTEVAPAKRSARSDAWLRGRLLELLLKMKHSKESEVYQYALSALSQPQTDPLLIEKGMLVLGSYPASPVPQEKVNPLLQTSLSYLATKLTVWKKDLGEPQYSGGSGGETDMTIGVEEPMVIDDQPFGEEGAMPKKGAKKKESKQNPFEKQAAAVKAKRRFMHEALEIVRFGYSGSRFGSAPTEIKNGLAAVVPEGEYRELMTELLASIKDLQDSLNSPSIVDAMTLTNETTPKADALLGVIEFILKTAGANPAPNGGNEPASSVPTPP